jgi:hypothetical protein
MTTGLTLLLEALIAPTALASSYLIPGEECIGISGLIAVEACNVFTHALLDGASTGGISIVIDRR